MHRVVPLKVLASDAQRALGYDEWFKKLPKELQHWWTVDVRCPDPIIGSCTHVVRTVSRTVEGLLKDDHQSGGER